MGSFTECAEMLVLIISLLGSFIPYNQALTIDKGLEDFKILHRSTGGEFLIPDGWKVLSLSDLSHPSVQAAMLALFTTASEVEMFNKGELKVIRELHEDEDIPEYDIVRRRTTEEYFIIPNGWQSLPENQLTSPAILNMLETVFNQNPGYREEFNMGLLTIIKKGWVRVPIDSNNSDKFQPILIEHW